LTPGSTPFSFATPLAFASPFSFASPADLAAAVGEREYLRLLGLPRGRALEGELWERSGQARSWYSTHGRPFAAARRIEIAHANASSLTLKNGTCFSDPALLSRLRDGEAHALVALAATAGPEVAAEAQRLWADEKPDEAYFLDRFAAAVVERLVFQAAGDLCRLGERQGETLLPHLSPGCGHWDLADQHRLMGLLADGPKLGPIELLSSGALRPPHSVLAVFGVSRGTGQALPEDLCRACDLTPCAFRRAPFTPKAVPALETP
jgi:hypothetical protein